MSKKLNGSANGSNGASKVNGNGNGNGHSRESALNAFFSNDLVVPPSVQFAGRTLSANDPALIVAEIGLNHCGEMDRALKLIEAAADAGADAVKFQKRKPTDMLTGDAYNQSYYNNGNSFGLTYGKHREALEFELAEYRDLKAAAEELGLQLFASVWDIRSLQDMAHIGVPAVKIPSADLTNEPLLAAIAEFDFPLFISTGMSRLDEIERATAFIHRLEIPTVLFHCVSIYPTPPEQARLSTLLYYQERFQFPVGYSGHEMDISVCVAARALGACVIEKHFTLDRSWKGGDQKISLLPEEFARMVEDIRIVEKALPDVRDGMIEGEHRQRKKLGKSIVASRDIRAGEVIDTEMIACKCPGGGLSPQNIHRLLGRKVKRAIHTDEYLLESHLEDAPEELPRSEGKTVE